MAAPSRCLWRFDTDHVLHPDRSSRLCLGSAETPITPSEFNVLIRWESGVEPRVSHFSSAQNAQGWIKSEGENWLRVRNGAPDFPQIKPIDIASGAEEGTAISALAA
jgi:hypothetical protein